MEEKKLSKRIEKVRRETWEAQLFKQQMRRAREELAKIGSARRSHQPMPAANSNKKDSN